MRYAHSLLSVLALATTSLPAQTALSVCATTPNLGALIRTVGEGTPIEVMVFARATQDLQVVRIHR